jgi:hypothetical protein
VRWFDSNPDQQLVDERLGATFDQLIAAARPNNARRAQAKSALATGRGSE